MWALKNMVGRFHEPFRGYNQHDSHEFLIKLMDWLHEDLNRATDKNSPIREQNHNSVSDYVLAEKMQERVKRKDDSVIYSLFHGLHRSVIECSMCCYRSVTFETFSVISLSFPPNGKCSLQELLQHYYKNDSIEYRCSKCRKLSDCTRKFDIWKLPPVLIIHLNRFEYNVEIKKKQNFVDFLLENPDLGKHSKK